MRKRMIFLFTFALVASLYWTNGGTQIVPENHYLVYEVPETYTFSGGIVLFDQFGDFSTDVVQFDKFATPVEKNGEPMFDPEVHQTWWNIFNPQPEWLVALDNQFGRQDWTVTDGRYLVVPARKDVPGPPPPFNHYECYDAVGPPVDMPVTLIDQFGIMELIATVPELFCNPCEKQVDGNIFPIEDPAMHLACYRLEPPMLLGVTAMAFDQFGDWQISLLEPTWLCLPTIKLSAVGTERSTWGKVKSLYHN